MIFHIENGQDLGTCKKIGDSVVIQRTFDIFPKKFQRDLRFRKISHMHPQFCYSTLGAPYNSRNATYILLYSKINIDITYFNKVYIFQILVKSGEFNDTQK
ncbi:MAG: hypothetical protein AYK18_14765 [Theionarchaea archaeon DG-70]|nr:MAG: hypothetical protein AYK18_14765 [Theionarchaea archaeon DG-70]